MSPRIQPKQISDITSYEDISTKTSAELHLYADGTTGSDTNSGLTSGNAKKTLQAVFDLLPDIITENVAINLSGVFADSSSSLAVTVSGADGQLIIDGGSSTTTIDSWTADTSSTTSIGLSTLNLVVDQYAGYMVEITSGAASGEQRLIKSHTTTTFTPATAFSTDPGSASFKVVKPATEIQGTVSIFGNTNAVHPSLQRLYFSGSSILLITEAGAYLNSCIFDSTGTAIQATRNARLFITGQLTDPSDFSIVASTVTKFGISQRNIQSKMILTDCSMAGPFTSYFRRLELIGCGFTNPLMFWDNRINGSVLIESIRGPQLASERPPALFTDTTIDNSDHVGLTIKDSSVLVDGLLVQNCASHGIELINAKLIQENSLTGTGNGGAGVYAHSGSSVLVQSGTDPTLTGTVGDLAISDPEVEEETWANINAGTNVAIAAEMTIVKAPDYPWTFIAEYSKDLTTTARLAAGTADPTVETRTGVAKQTNSASDYPQIQELATDTFRFEEYGILIEPESVENKIVESLTVGNGAWLESRLSVISNNVVAPDGTTTAETLNEGTLTNQHQIYLASRSETLGVKYCFSVYAKPENRDFLQLAALTGTTNKQSFNIADGTVGTGSSIDNAGVKRINSDWVRIWCSWTADATSSSRTWRMFLLEADNDNSFTGLDQDSVTVWQPQMETGVDEPTSQITTTSSTASRGAESLRYSGTSNVPSGSGKLKAKIKVPETLTGGDCFVCSLNASGSETARIEVRIQETTGFAAVAIKDTTLQVDAYGTTDLTDGPAHTIELRWNTDDVQLIVDGVTEVTDTSASIPSSLDRIDVGSDYAGNGQPIHIAYLKIGNL